jgi:hypothetical protein
MLTPGQIKAAIALTLASVQGGWVPSTRRGTPIPRSLALDASAANFSDQSNAVWFNL